MNRFDFEIALFLLKKGHRVARAGWNGKGMWLALVRPASENDAPSYKPVYMAGGEEIVGLTRLPWIGMRTADNGFVPWLASQTDMLAEDWVDLGVMQGEAAPPPEDPAPERAPLPRPTVDEIIAVAVENLLSLAASGSLGGMPAKPVDVLETVCRKRLAAFALPIPTGLRTLCNDALLAALMKD